VLFRAILTAVATSAPKLLVFAILFFSSAPFPSEDGVITPATLHNGGKYDGL
jgi:hypothetical protein